MPVTLGSLDRGVVVTRTGGTLQYHNADIPLGEVLLIGHVKSGVCDLVLPNGSVVAIPAADMTGCFVVSELPPSDDSINRATTALVRSFRQPIIGELIEPRTRMLIRRTGRPFHAMHEHYAPHDVPLMLSDTLSSNSVSYQDTDRHAVRMVPRRYLTTAYFEVLALRVPTADEFIGWLQAVRRTIKRRLIDWDDLQERASEYGLNPPVEIRSYWLENLNDPSVSLGQLVSYLTRLLNLFAEEPSMQIRSLAELQAMGEGERRDKLDADPHNGWRRQMIYIGLVLRHREMFRDVDVKAAVAGLLRYRP